ncbi:sentrin-specific protease-like [Astatotilapia calliptera]|uniref:sentrin-specific protease-like n=1 Tax=Astatotilapia calliptera TaxID=8154 RepID=UPI000E403F08|nr:sentrin-specific protease-like [Astatotilapia calliptera]
MFIVLTFFHLWPVGLYPAFPLKISCMPELTYHIFLLVKRLWRAKDTGRLESVVGPYKLFDSSLRTLQGSRWLSDEVIDAYLHRVIERRKNAVHLLCSVVASSLFSGQFRCLTKMKFPVEDMWLCPVNFGTHWILVIVNISAQKILLIDPMGNEGVYDRKILHNWRNFLRMRGHEDTMEWQLQTMQHNNQQDSSSCGVLLLKFAEHYLAFGERSVKY